MLKNNFIPIDEVICISDSSIVVIKYINKAFLKSQSDFMYTYSYIHLINVADTTKF